jgi:pilus assembly protein Flp/PilA
MSYNFGSVEQFEQIMRDYYLKRLFHPRARRLHEVALAIHGEMTPDQFFEAWEPISDETLSDGFPARPLWLKRFVDSKFYGEIKVCWRQRHADYRAKYGNEEWDISLILNLFLPLIRLVAVAVLCAFCGKFVTDPGAQAFYYGIAGLVMGFYLIFDVLLALARAFYLPERRSLVSAFNAKKARQKTGQGLVEYALILVLVAIVVIVILALLGPAIGNVFSNIVESL